MLGSFRKFSTSLYAKILLIIIIIPFVFWGMGSSLSGGDQNIVVKINKDKYSIQDFDAFIKRTAYKKIESNEEINEYLSAFIGEQLIKKEVNHYKIKVSDKSLSQLIKNQKQFKRDGDFSRTEYEKFLIKNNITAVNFENILASQERKKQILDLIGGGVYSSKFLINAAYDRVNQKRDIELINLNTAFSKNLKVSDVDIEKYFKENKNKYNEIYKSIKLLELTPKNVLGKKEDFNDLFFKKIDEIDDLIISGINLDNIILNFNLNNPVLLKINKFGKKVNSNTAANITENLVKSIFDLDDGNKTALLDVDNKYFIVEVLKTEKLQKSISDPSFKKLIADAVEKEIKRGLTAKIIDEINKNNFKKSDFNKLAGDYGVKIEKITLTNQNDSKILKTDIVGQIYNFAEKKIIVVNELGLSENYLIYIKNIKRAQISENSKEYQKYSNLSKARIINNLYNTYDEYLKKKYEIIINYKTIDKIKNYNNQ